MVRRPLLPSARWLCVVQWAAVAAATVLSTAAPASAQTAGAPPAPYLVVPFENTAGDGRVHWLTEASAIILTDDLLALNLSVVSYEDRVRALERLNVPAVSSLSHATRLRLAQLVGAAQLLVGSFTVKGDTLTVRVRTIRVDVARMSPEMVESGPIDDLFDIYARIVRRILPVSDLTLERMEQDHPPAAAFEQYVKGLLAQVPATRISYLTHARRLAPTFQRPRLALWTAYQDQGSHEEALTAVQEVPEGHRLYRRAQFLAGVSLVQLGRYDEAFESLYRLNAASPDPALFNNLGVLQLRRQAVSDPRAVSLFGDALRIDGSDSDVMFNLGYAYFLERDPMSAVGWLREALRRNPADAEAHYVLGVALQTSGSAAEGARERELARRLSADIARLETSGSDEHVPRGLERMKTDIDVPASLRVHAAIVESGQRDQREAASFHLEAGRRLFRGGRDIEAIAELRRTVFLAPYHSEAHLLLGRLYLRTGRADAAVDALTISIWSTDTVQARLVLAEAYVVQKNVAAARAEVQAVLARDPQNAEARRLLAALPPD
jgi:tetratricopeptide (TPR) repeat protein